MLGYRQAVRHQVLILAFVSSNLATPANFFRYDPLAQSAEHLTFNQGVRSSSLRWVTIKAKLQVRTYSRRCRTPRGEVSEWFKELVLKTSDPARDRGFESHPLRQIVWKFSFHKPGEVLKWLKRTVC